MGTSSPNVRKTSTRLGGGLFGILPCQPPSFLLSFPSYPWNRCYSTAVPNSSHDQTTLRFFLSVTNAGHRSVFQRTHPTHHRVPNRPGGLAVPPFNSVVPPHPPYPPAPPHAEGLCHPPRPLSRGCDVISCYFPPDKVQPYGESRWLGFSDQGFFPPPTPDPAAPWGRIPTPRRRGLRPFRGQALPSFAPKAFEGCH